MTTSRLDRYRIESLLGEGTGGTVHLARDLSLEREVALKVIRLSSTRIRNAEETRVRFLREVKLTARLSHPNIVVVYDFGEEEDTLFLAMEHIPGGTLARRLAPGAVPFPVAERLLLGAELAEAIAHAHGKGILHRDLKPANILLTAEGAPKVTDFGIGKLVSGDVDLTGSGEMIGSPAYMSPEQMRGERVDTRSDIFGLGSVLYHLFTGRRPFDAENLTGLVAQVQHEPHPDVFTFAPELPRAVGPVLARCLAKGRDERYESAAVLARDLRALVPAEGSFSDSSVRRLRRRIVPVRDDTGVGLETMPIPPAPGPLDPTRATGERAAQNAPTVKSQAPGPRSGHLGASLAALVVVAAGLILLVRSTSAPRTEPQAAPLVRPTRPASAPPSPAPATPEAAMPTAIPEPTPTAHVDPTATPALLLGKGPAVPATSRELGESAARVQPRTERVEAGRGVALRVRPAQANVTVDGRAFGVAADWDDRSGGAPLAWGKPGRHQVRLSFPGHRDLVVEVVTGAPDSPVVAVLDEELPEGLPSSGTAAPRNAPRPDVVTAGSLRLDVEPSSARVTVDGRAVGAASRWASAGLALATPGVHEVALAAPGRETAVLRVVCSPLGPEAPPPVKRALAAR